MERISEYSLRKSFLEALIKAGGEGSRGGKIIGHTPSGKPIYATDGRAAGGPSGRKPYPGQDQHAAPMTETQKKKTYMPPEGLEPHYADSKPLRIYKLLVKKLKSEGMDFQGHITFDPKTNAIHSLTEQGSKNIRDIISKYQAQSGGGSATPKSGASQEARA